jgi:DNA repair protein RadC
MEDTDLNKTYVLRVRDLPENEKPREKLINCGPEILTTTELMAVIFSVGTKKEEVLIMSSRIIKEYGEKAIAFEKSPEKISEELDIPISKACQIVACFELGKRFFQNHNGKPATVRTAKQAYEYLKDMGSLSKEHLRGIYLNSHYKIIRDEVISVGSLTANIVHPREVFRPAIEHNAAALIIAHNHPSGSSRPTQSDIEITKQLIESGRILGIELLDHLIIGKNKFSCVPIEK